MPNEQQLGLLWKLAGPIARVRGWICTASSYFYRSIVWIMKSAEQREKNRFTGYFAGKKSNTKQTILSSYTKMEHFWLSILLVLRSKYLSIYCNPFLLYSLILTVTRMKKGSLIFFWCQSKKTGSISKLHIQIITKQSLVTDNVPLFTERPSTSN